MKRIIIAAVASTFGGAALAGGLAEPVQAPVVMAPAPAAYDWSGFYGGLQAGGMDGDLRLNGVNLNNTNNNISEKFGISGTTLGVFAGYNWTQGPTLVYGIEGELNLANVDGRLGETTGSGLGFLRGGIDADVKNTGALRGRIGHAMGRTLIYATGGVAFAKVELQGTDNGGDPSGFTPSKRLTGWTIGAGVEHAMTANWNLRLDYRYSDLSGDFNFTSEMETPHSFDLKMKSHDIRIGAVYRF